MVAPFICAMFKHGIPERFLLCFSLNLLQCLIDLIIRKRWFISILYKIELFNFSAGNGLINFGLLKAVRFSINKAEAGKKITGIGHEEKAHEEEEGKSRLHLRIKWIPVWIVNTFCFLLLDRQRNELLLLEANAKNRKNTIGECVMKVSRKCVMSSESLGTSAQVLPSCF